MEAWLENLPLAHGTRAKLRNLMHVIYNHGIRCRFTAENPITLVRQSAKRGRVPDVLTVAELKGLLSELKEPWRTAVFVASTTGLRASELLALKWQDFDFTSGQLNLCRGIVRQHIGGMKSEASRKPLPLDAGLAEVLLAWRRICPFNQDADYVFGSLDKKGQQPYWPTAGMENHIRPAAKRADITKRIGWHTLRHTFGTLVKSQGADVATTKELMRHANVSITMDRYVQAVGEQKKQAQHSVVGLIGPKWPHGVDNTACILLNRKGWALNSAVECHLHTVEVIGSNPIAPTIYFFPYSTPPACLDLSWFNPFSSQKTQGVCPSGVEFLRVETCG